MTQLNYVELRLVLVDPASNVYRGSSILATTPYTGQHGAAVATARAPREG